MENRAKKRYTKEFKKEAVNLVGKQGYTNTESAKNLGVSEATIRHWRKLFGAARSSVDLKKDSEIKRLKEEKGSSD
ncbi:transposase [Desulfogranum marinum]|uniref:transposase n=1 Tax=Desulfogranum marinum TaxID=453220 RepID=UPI0029C64F75|nr:transposase [Desulfogranum marinum]